jgi:hypothetical protein
MDTNRLSFDHLIQLNRAAEDCHGLTLEFVRDFAEPVESSICDDVTPSRVRERLRHAEEAIKGIRDAITKWDLSPNRGGAIERIAQAIGLSQPIISFGDRSYLTAHEAARETAKQVAAISGRLACKAGDEIAVLAGLENRLKQFSFPDLCARIEGEFWEASKLIEMDEEPDPQHFLGIILGDRKASRLLDGDTLESEEFGNKGQAWKLLTMLVEAGAAGVSCRGISDAFAKPYDRKKEVQELVNKPLRLDIRTIGKNWTLVHIPKPGEKSPGNG